MEGVVLNFGKYDVLNYPGWWGGSTCIILRLIFVSDMLQC